jgi:hypothetical protein
LLPGGEQADETQPRLILLAAGALLALVIASGALLPVAVRFTRGFR